DRYVLLSDSDTVASAGLKDEQVIYITFRTGDGMWEDVYIEPYPIDTEDTEDDDAAM
ncbi:hypothetical protein EV182_006447, partial [Spiromyces aspiralis]